MRNWCNGGCPKDRFALSRDGEPGQNYLCRGFERFFNHTGPTFQTMAQLFQKGFAPAQIMETIAELDARRSPDSPVRVEAARNFGFCHGESAAFAVPWVSSVARIDKEVVMASKKPNILILWGDDIG